MPLVTRTELLELVPELRAMAAAATTATVRDTITLLADRYAAMAAVRPDAMPAAHLSLAGAARDRVSRL